MWQDTIKKHYAHKINRDEILIKTCPYCQNDKYNLQISSTKNIFSCWVCSASGRIEKFFKDQNLEFDTTGWRPTILMPERKTVEKLNLENFRPLNYTANKTFLDSRGIDAEDIFNYHLLTATYGRYKNKMIIPLMENNRVVYFVSRDLFPKGKYVNPVINKKEFLLTYPGSRIKNRLYIVEGAFDAISVNKLGFSVAMLLGSSLSTEQKKKIRNIGFTEVVICLDGDLKKKAMEMYQDLNKEGIKTKIVLIPGNEDPNDLFVSDKEYLQKLLENPRDITFNDLVEQEEWVNDRQI